MSSHSFRAHSWASFNDETNNFLLDNYGLTNFLSTNITSKASEGSITFKNTILQGKDKFNPID